MYFDPSENMEMVIAIEGPQLPCPLILYSIIMAHIRSMSLIFQLKKIKKICDIYMVYTDSTDSTPWTRRAKLCNTGPHLAVAGTPFGDQQAKT